MRLYDTSFGTSLIRSDLAFTFLNEMNNTLFGNPIEYIGKMIAKCQGFVKMIARLGNLNTPVEK